MTKIFQKINKDSRGFTLMEVMVYLALFAVFFAGAVAASYNVIESTGKDRYKTMVQEEGDFLTSKIEWVMSGVQDINAPAAGDSGAMLSINKATGVEADGSAIIAPITIALSANDMVLGYPGGSGPNAFTLNNSNVKVEGLIFVHSVSLGQGINPESIEASFTLSTKTPGGADYSQFFKTAVYLRK